MIITSVFAAMPSYCGGLLSIKKVVSDTLNELGVDTDDVNLAFNSLPVYDGMRAENMAGIAASLRKADGVIFYYNASFGLPGAMIQTFLEHLSYNEYKDILKGKNCFLVAYGDGDNIMEASCTLSNALLRVGAFTGERLAVDEFFCDNIKEGGLLLKMVERQTEDFYRLVRQKRTMYIPGSYKESDLKSEQAAVIAVINETFDPEEPVLNYAESVKEAAPQPVNAKSEPSTEEINDALKRFLDMTDNDEEDEDINEIARLFEKKLNNRDIEPKIIPGDKPETLGQLFPDIRPKAKNPNLMQNTAAITHYYRPGQAEGLDIKIMLNITGEEGFDGHIVIKGTDCWFYETFADSPDVTIVAADKVWADIVKGKVSAQKAFMIGQIKVRGNFILLSKFDQIFDLKKV
ncbi:MAG: SCP2 sterol-binding domain-containing protein [Clostridiales bacterium]|jgi:putative sterol carrier protein/multimeric flavodoxin WrbA|nr:SCP2 sterol-binding domain-containing protein [Clostridiales bacterium]